MDKAEIKAQADHYCEQPKDWRRSDEGKAAFAELAPAVQAKVREILEARRGFRRVNGVIEMTEEALVAEIARLEEKEATLDARKEAIAKVIAEKKAELAERFGSNE